MEGARRLKRGLKDLSPLFESEKGDRLLFESKSNLSPFSSPSFQVLSVFSPDLSGDSLFLNSFFASRLARKEQPCTILSIQSRYTQARASWAPESLGPYLKRRVLFWDEFEKICRRPLSLSTDEEPLSQILFLDLELLHAPHAEKAVTLLDTWIIFIRPTLESMAESFKMIKAASSLNPKLEFFLLFEGSPSDPRGPYLYERFSEMVSRRLRAPLAWLGCLHLPKNSQAISMELELGGLVSSPPEVIELPEKMALAELVRWTSVA